MKGAGPNFISRKKLPVFDNEKEDEEDAPFGYEGGIAL